MKKQTVKSLENKQQLLHHLSRIAGQVNGIMKMVESDQDCVRVLNQIQAARNSLSSVGKAVLINGVCTCGQARPVDLDKILNKLFLQ
ncbi:MAG TPA: metal-sensitive transcriptional regulator [Candidatus Woesebacteria bacterium]|nr:metal-sensitive transcriptional regulator [Candidatus Woesebacteria bacterium]